MKRGMGCLLGRCEPPPLRDKIKHLTRMAHLSFEKEWGRSCLKAQNDLLISEEGTDMTNLVVLLSSNIHFVFLRTLKSQLLIDQLQINYK